jgi:hypothetical protein
MLIAVCPPDSKLPRSLYERTHLDTSSLRATRPVDRTVRNLQPSSGLWFGGSAANVELVPHSLCQLHCTRRRRASPARPKQLLVQASRRRHYCTQRAPWSLRAQTSKSPTFTPYRGQARPVRLLQQTLEEAARCGRLQPQHPPTHITRRNPITGKHSNYRRCSSYGSSSSSSSSSSFRRRPSCRRPQSRRRPRCPRPHPSTEVTWRPLKYPWARKAVLRLHV